jgi:sugar phosphate isomerase/epimerase
VSANFNSIHPGREVRREGIRRAGLLASRCAALGARIMTMCTGTRDPDNMWRKHSGNMDRDAWCDLLQTTHLLVSFAEEFDLTLVFEPEVVNVIDSAATAQRFLEEIGSPRLRVLLDPANLIRPEDLPNTQPVLRDAFQRLGPYIAMAHAKDVASPALGDSECRRVAAGQGQLDYAYYLEQLDVCGFGGALVLHDLTEVEIQGCRSMLERLLSKQVS